MKIKLKRCLTLVVCLLFLSSQIALPAQAAHDLTLDCGIWDYLMIYGEEFPSDPDTIIIYLHGDNVKGTAKEDLDLAFENS